MSKNLVKATGVILVVNLIVKLLGFVRESVIAAGFGASFIADAYVVAYTIPYFLQAILGAAIVAAIVPVITSYMTEQRGAEAWKVGSLLINVIGLLLLALTLISIIAAPLLVKLTAPGFNAEQLALSVKLARIMFPLVFLMGIGMVITGILNGCYRFVAAAFAPGISNIVIIAFVLLFASNWGIEGLAVGTLVSFIGFLLIMLPSLKKIGFKYSFVLDFRHPLVKRVLHDILPMLVGVAINQVYLALNRVFASSLAGGSISSLNYANKLMNLPVGIFVAAVAAAVYPALAEAAQSKRDKVLAQTVNKGLSLISLVAIPSAIGLIMLSEPLVQLLFERGAFDRAATLQTSYALICFSVGILPVALNMVMIRAFYALGDVKTPVYTGIISIVVDVLLCLLLMSPMQHGGLALANSIAAFVNIILLYIIFCRKVEGMQPRVFLLDNAKMLLAALLMSAAVWAIDSISALQGSTLLLLVRMVLAVGIGCVVYAAAALLLRVQGLNELLAQFKRKYLRQK